MDGGHRCWVTLHFVIRSDSPVVLKMLSSLEYLLVTMCCSIGIPFGRGIAFAINPMRPSVNLLVC